MKKILFIICLGFVVMGVHAQTAPQKPANQETINEAKKAATTGVATKRDTSGGRNRMIPANAQTSKYLLMQLFNSVKNSAYKDTTTATRVSLFKSLKGLEELDYLKIFMPKLIAAYTPSAFKSTWVKKENSWSKQMKAVTTPVEFNQLLVELESQLTPASFTDKWNNEYRAKWLGEMQRVK